MDILISGASTGIGRACAVHLARLGHVTWAGVRSQKSFDEITRLNVRGLKPVMLDVDSDESVRAGVREVLKNSGTLHAVVNNAGFAVGGPVEAVTLEDWRRQFETNVLGVVRVTQAALPALRESRGRIVNMSSISGRVGFPFMGPYAASKFALEGLSDSLRRELADCGVRVALIEPGAIATPIWNKARREGLGRLSKLSAEMNDVYGARLRQFADALDEIIEKAAPVDVVVRAVEHALLARNPRTRYPVGRGIRASAWLSRVMPDVWLDRAFKRRM